MATVSNVHIDEGADRVHITDLTVHDADLVEYLTSFEDQERDQAAEQALRVGAITLELADTSKEVEFVKREFGQMQEAFNTEINDIRDELEARFGDNGQVPALLDAHLGDGGKLQRLINEALGEDGEFARRLDEELGEDGERFQSALDPDREGTPLYRLKEFLREEVRGELREEIREIKEELQQEETEAQIRQRTTLKGKDFEADVESLLEDLVHGTNNQVEFTGDTEGELTGRDVGDFVVTLGDTGQRIVIESKSEQNYTQPKIKHEMDEAIENRDADYGMFVTECESYVPRKVGYLKEFDNRILSVALSANEDDSVDPRLLKIGFNWATMRTIQAGVEAGDAVDAEAIQSRVTEVRDAVDRFRTVRTKCSNIRGTVQDIEDLLDEIEADVNSDLNRITAELSKRS